MKPPIDQPSTFTHSVPRASTTCSTSSASLAISNGRPSSLERPIPRLSMRIRSLEDASRWIKAGSQSALEAAKPLMTTSGRPFPIRRQAICAPSTWTSTTDSLAIADVRKSPNYGQGDHVRKRQADRVLEVPCHCLYKVRTETFVKRDSFSV